MNKTARAITKCDGARKSRQIINKAIFSHTYIFTRINVYLKYKGRGEEEGNAKGGQFHYLMA